MENGLYYEPRNILISEEHTHNTVIRFSISLSIYLSLGFQVFIVGSDGFGLEKLDGSGDGQLRQGKSGRRGGYLGGVLVACDWSACS